MKTVIDWATAPDGATPCAVAGTFFKEENGRFAFYSSKGWLIDNNAQPERINMTERPKAEAKPIFTKAMADNNVWPSADMELLVAFDDSPCTKGRIEYTNDNGFLFRYSDNGLNDFISFDITVTFKPITPPIELIDGEKYEVEITFGDYRVGYYSSVRNSFFDGILYSNKICGRSECTSVKLLKIA